MQIVKNTTILFDPVFHLKQSVERWFNIGFVVSLKALLLKGFCHLMFLVIGDKTI